MKYPVLLRSRSFVYCCVAVALCSSAAGCGAGPGGPGSGAGPGHREQVLALTPEQEVALGDKAFAEVLAESESVKGVPLERVKGIGERIFHVALTDEPLQREMNLRLKGWNWDDRRYAVLQKDEINAFCLPGGKVAVYTGLLDFVRGNDDWLATVMSHEAAHALAHHASERIAWQGMSQQAAGSPSALPGGERNKLLALLGVGGQLRELAYDRQQESEADHIGVFLMTFAGYNPEEAVRFWEEMRQRSGGGSVPEILSDHPSDARRVAQLRKWAVRAEEALQAQKAGRVEPPPTR